MKSEDELNPNVSTTISFHESRNPSSPPKEESPWFLSKFPAHVEESECSAEMRTILREFLADECLLTTRNQNTLCCHWDITPDCISRAASQRRMEEEYREAILLTWQPQSLFEFNCRILPVSFASHHVYLTVPFLGRAYQVEVGWISRTGVFVSILASNPSTVR